jgi:hypothetical protein
MLIYILVSLYVRKQPRAYLFLLSKRLHKLPVGNGAGEIPPPILNAGVCQPAGNFLPLEAKTHTSIARKMQYRNLPQGQRQAQFQQNQRDTHLASTSAFSHPLGRFTPALGHARHSTAKVYMKYRLKHSNNEIRKMVGKEGGELK